MEGLVIYVVCCSVITEPVYHSYVKCYMHTQYLYIMYRLLFKLRICG